MTPASALTILLAGALCATLIYGALRARSVAAPQSAVALAWSAVALLMVCVVFFLAGRIIGVPEYQIGGEATSVIVNGFLHWVLFSLALGGTLWALQRARG